jgi:hypothetical protein
MDGEAGAKALNAQRASSDIDMSDPAIAEAWSMAQKSSTLTYVALGYAAGSKKKLAVIATGEDGYAGLKAHLGSGVVYAGLAVRADGARRLVFVCSIAGAGGMARGKASMHKQDVENALEGTKGSITIADEEELEEISVVARPSSVYIETLCFVCFLRC